MCSRNSCCPTITFSEDGLTANIKDDFGGSVKLLIEELDILMGIVTNFKKHVEE